MTTSISYGEESKKSSATISIIDKARVEASGFSRDNIVQVLCIGGSAYILLTDTKENGQIVPLYEPNSGVNVQSFQQLLR